MKTLTIRIYEHLSSHTWRINTSHNSSEWGMGLKFPTRKAAIAVANAIVAELQDSYDAIMVRIDTRIDTEGEER